MVFIFYYSFHKNCFRIINLSIINALFHYEKKKKKKMTFIIIMIIIFIKIKSICLRSF